MTRRNAELLLLLAAAPVVFLLYGMNVVNQGLPLDVHTLSVPIGMAIAFVIAHIATRIWAPSADAAILPISFALSGIGISFVTRLAPELAERQVLWLFAGVACMVLVLVFLRRIERVANYKYTLMLAGFLLLLSPMVPGLGQEIYGSRIWLSLGAFSFQPGEIAKIMIVLFLAGYLAANREMLSIFTVHVGPFNLPDFRTLLPMMLMWGVSLAIVVFEKDLGSALVVFFIFIFMLYAASGKKSYVVTGLLLAAVGAVALWSVFGHIQVRVSTWLDPFADANGLGYQLCQAIYSMADGDLFGVGIGKGLCDQIPVVESDYIFAAIAEECGLLGAAGVLLLYLCFGIRGMITAARAKSDVSSFIACGLTSAIVLQAFIIVGGVTRLIPLTGLTLPFVSQGGSSLLASFIIVGFLLACGNEATGITTEMQTGASATTQISSANSVLGRVSLGKRLTVLMIIISLMFAALVANLTMLMVVNADYYKQLPSNNHTLQKQQQRERGTISTYDGTVLARSVKNDDGTYSREYPAGDLASQVVGYASTQYGTSGIESAEDTTLTGKSGFANWTDVINAYAGISTSGNDVRLTINTQVQQAAQNALNGFNGACVVMDPKTGAILAMASSPTYDAADFESVLAQGDSGDSSAAFNRAIQALYAPGSTFKALSLSEAIQDNIAKETDVYASPGSMEIGGAEVHSYDGYAYGDITLARATELSSNTVFGQLGVQIGPKRLVEAAEKFGLNKEIPFTLPTAVSLMPNPDEMTEWETAWSAIGQPVGQHESPAGPQVTVLQMAMVASAIANGGTIQTPYLVDSVYNPNGERISETTPKAFSSPISASTAERVKKVLTGVVTSGTGTGAQIPGVSIAGKTGTAETGKSVDDSWFIGMGPTEDCSVVVAIVLEQGATGSTNAAIRANNVLRSALTLQGKL